MDLKQWGKYQNLKKPAQASNNSNDILNLSSTETFRKVKENQGSVNQVEVPSNLHAPILNQPKAIYNAQHQNFPYLYSNPSQAVSTMISDDPKNNSFVKPHKKDSMNNSESRNFDFLMNHQPLLCKSSKFFEKLMFR